MPTFNIMPKEGVSLPRLSISVFMIIRLVLLISNCIIMGVIGYYFSNSRGSFRQNLFHEELMMLVCSVFAFITTIISMVSKNKRYDWWIVFLILQISASAVSSYNGYSEIISNCMTSFLLTISGVVLLIQVFQRKKVSIQMSIFNLFSFQFIVATWSIIMK